MSILGASYQVLPVLKLHAGVGASTNTNQSAVAATLNTGVATGASLVTGTGTVANTSSYQFGATYDLNSSIVVMAQSAKVDDKSSTNTDRTMLGLGVDYKFSKTSRAYVRYDSINFASNLAASTGTAQKRTAVGISTAF
jgi:predicted porin